MVSAGNRYPSVFPDPVLAIARTSVPVMDTGHAAPCTAEGLGNPCLFSRVINVLGKGAALKSRHTFVSTALS